MRTYFVYIYDSASSLWECCWFWSSKYDLLGGYFYDFSGVFSDRDDDVCGWRFDWRVFGGSFVLTTWARKTIKKLGAPTAVFFAIMIISVGFSVVPLWNYTRFYLALWNFDYTVSSVTVDRSQINATNINAVVYVNFNITNPTDYSGLQVAQISCRLQYLRPVGHYVVENAGYRSSTQVWTYWWDLGVKSTNQRYPIGSNTKLIISLELFVNPYSGSQSDKQIAWDFINHLRTPTTQEIQWSLTCLLTLSTFIGSFQRGPNDFEPLTTLS